VFGVVDDVVYPVKMHLCVTCLRCSDFCPAHAISTRWTVRA
jgi:formate hydrogenlyase subunit 6/NADH:ubiquinone oxidoreductase subunit I